MKYRAYAMMGDKIISTEIFEVPGGDELNVFQFKFKALDTATEILKAHEGFEKLYVMEYGPDAHNYENCWQFLCGDYHQYMTHWYQMEPHTLESWKLE